MCLRHRVQRHYASGNPAVDVCFVFVIVHNLVSLSGGSVRESVLGVVRFRRTWVSCTNGDGAINVGEEQNAVVG